MIKLQNMTPSVYYDKSRDFQYIGRLYDIVLNAVKTDIDTIKYINDIDTCDGTLLNLLALTLGFEIKHEYNAVQLRAICSVLATILKNKGSIKAVTTACDAILAAEGITEAADYSFENGLLTIYLPYTLADTALIEDLLDYILPAGICCTIVKELKIKTTSTTKIGLTDYVQYYQDSADKKMQPYLSTLAEGIDPEHIRIDNSSTSAGTIENVTIWRPETTETPGTDDWEWNLWNTDSEEVNNE